MLSHVLARALNVIKAKRIRLYSSVSYPDIDVDYYCNQKNSEEIKQNIARRKGIGDLQKVLEMYNVYKQTSVNDSKYDIIKSLLFKELGSLPNKTHPSVKDYEEEPRLVHELNDKRDFNCHTPLEFSEITRRLNLMRTDKLGQTCGHKSYYFLGELAELEEALIKYSVSALLNKGFELVSVPDILPSNVLESCGMTVNSDRTQVCALLYLRTYETVCKQKFSLKPSHDSTCTCNKVNKSYSKVYLNYNICNQNLIEEKYLIRRHFHTLIDCWEKVNFNFNKSILVSDH